MKQKTRMLRGISSIMAFLLILAIFGGMVANANAGGINNFFGLTGETHETVNTVFASEYGELNDSNLAKLIADEMVFCTQQLEEGSVLLKNDGVLPLAGDERKVTLFGRASADIVYRSSCGGPSADPSRLIDLKTAFESEGFSINETLYNAYAGSSTARVKSGDERESIGEVPIGFYTDAMKATFSDYSDAAIVVLSRYGGESSDLSRNDIDGMPVLRLHQSEADMLKMINDSGVFDKIVVLINSVYPMELGWLDEYHVGACLWIGNPGFYGLPGIVNILTGGANPSGKTVDTFAANSLSSAAMQNFGTYYFENGDDLPSQSNRYVVYAEGIYVGYRYYETRYEDSILGQGNAEGDAGIFASSANWNYAEEICYPFGYGLSYTDFQQELLDCTYDASSDTFKATVKVTNIGSVPGKSVVELYVQAPYTEYDKEHLVEKASVQLVGYGKTQSLQPSEVETVTITFPRYLFASYDTTVHDGAGGYILDDGTYFFAIGDNCHDALNNILAAKGAAGMYDIFGNPVTGNAENVIPYVLDSFDDQSYLVSCYTDAEVHNLFNNADPNAYYEEQVVTYLSRQDWQNTWNTGVKLSNNEKITNSMQTANYKVSATTTPLSDVTYGKEAGIKLYNMIGVSYDDPKWETFIQQMSISDLSLITSENYGQGSIKSIGMPPQTNGEGPEGLSRKYKYGDQQNATGYASGVVNASTWSHEMQTAYGRFLGEDALFCGVNAINGPGGNTHRTPYGGRAAEYCSEDSIISYYTGSNVIGAMADKGLIGSYKHFFLNEQEYDRQGIATFSNEQAIREIYLRAFEGSVTSTECHGIMTSYNRLGTTYMAANPAVQFSLLRDEWGFKGYLITDYIFEGVYAVTADMMINGSNVFGGNDRSKSLTALINDNNDGDMLLKAQESAHHILWAYTNSSMANVLAPETTYNDFTAWWQYVITAIQVVLGIVTACVVLLYVKSLYFGKGKRSGGKQQ